MNRQPQIQLLYGKNRYSLNDYLLAYQQTEGFQIDQLIKLDISENNLNLAAILTLLMSQSLFMNKQLIIIYNLSFDKSLFETLMTKIVKQDITINNDLIIIEGPKYINKLISKKIIIKNFKELTPNELIVWLKNIAKNNNWQITDNNIQLLLNKLNTKNQYFIENELYKLSLINSNITQELIDSFVDLSPRDEAFNLLKAAINRQYKKVETIYRDLLLIKKEPQIILGLIVWQLHLMAIIIYNQNKFSMNQIAATNNLNQYSLSEASKLAHNFTKQQIRQKIIELSQLDNDFKQHKLDFDQAFLAFLYSF